MQAISKRPLEGKWGEITDFHLGVKHALWEFNPGRCYLPGFFENYAQQILDAPVREDDVWLISYPRTGSTWCQEIVWLLGNNMDFQKAESTLQQIRAPLIEMSVALYEYADQFKNVFTNSVDFVNKLPSPRFLKSHLPFQLLPKDLQKIIYLMRNPKDTCVSLFYHCRLLHGFDVDFDTFCELFLDGAVIYGDLLDHCLEFWSRRNEEHLLILRYEDLKVDTKSCVKLIADFMGKSASDKEVEELVDYIGFSKMRRNRSCNAEVLLNGKGGRKYFDEMGCHFIRKGEIGDWKNHMSPDIVGKFDEWIERKTYGTGLIL
ncbi:unnamed protein product [Phyllotreta striolata]|uniref:Sulfotransferase domain-containing protein n=1 Tax=Phyllotreta striolata TaxID=444603 RepID=A0A9N9TMJ1_PHYSR|nr:unnamed protein product [Phyllotreta striolata]